jgi:hypothetical protein
MTSTATRQLNTNSFSYDSISSVVWGLPPAVFELSSSDDAVLRHAESALAPWRYEASAPAPTTRWHIDASLSSRAAAGKESSEADWVVTGTGAACEQTIRCTSVQRAVMTVEYLAVQHLLERPDSVLLHAALLSRQGRGIIVVGPCGAGKSTLACSLWRHGWSLLGDDGAIFDQGALDTRCAPVARPTPRRVSLRMPSRELLGEEMWSRILQTPSCTPTAEGYVFHPHEVQADEFSTGSVGKPVQLSATPVCAILFLSRRGISLGPAQVRPLNAAEALLALLPYSNSVRVLDAGSALARLQPLAQALPAYDLGRGPLESMTQCIDELVSNLSSVS